ncbi:hypothetical protein CFter6_1310 [Collimonas fungivorans]|uniref:Uncharacterized protein n=1 Tax=Collimonas fungivorans TaxID=158899 RepID=A0A127P878_9BURK|nr:hypothetical protein [Collimonas fungivorans]AMO94022.1 hypothetical protein CFter6_1310 [Collimonas fungivorans]
MSNSHPIKSKFFRTVPLSIFIASLIFIPVFSHATKKEEVKDSKESTEAFVIGKQYIESKIFQCNGQHFFRYRWGISDGVPSFFQILEPKITLFSGRPITDVERLNGLQWKGGMKLTFRAIRVLEEIPVPSCSGIGCEDFNKAQKADKPSWRWSEWAERPNGINIVFEKRNGEWDNQPSIDGNFSDPKSCEAIPFETPQVKLPSASHDGSEKPKNPFKI